RISLQHDPGLAGVGRCRYVFWTTRDGQRYGERRKHDGDRSGADHCGWTWIARLVPRTPTMAAGVSRRMESGASLAMRPETYAAAPCTNLSTKPRAPSAGA